MKPLLKIMFILMLFFVSILALMNLTGAVTIGKIEGWLLFVKEANPIYTIVIIIGLLVADLFITVPTLAVIILGGYFLGPVIGAITSILGLLLAGLCGYGISLKYGEFFIKLIVKEQNEREKSKQTFMNYGGGIILFSRAIPMLPEVSVCMAGITRMPFIHFLVLWLISIVPYAILISYVGSISTLSHPTPTILTAVCLNLFLCSAWLLFKKIKNRRFTTKGFQ